MRNDGSSGSAARLGSDVSSNSGPTGPTLHAAEPCRDDRDPHLAGEPRIDGSAEDDVGLVRRRLAHDLGRLVHLDEREIVAARDREQDAACADDLRVDERRAQRALRSLSRAVLSGRVADSHERGAGVLHDRSDVGEVEVDEAGGRDQVTDPLDALAQHVIRDLERVDHRRRAVEHLEESVVGDDDDGVAGGAQLVDAALGCGSPAGSLEPKRRRDDPDREGSELACDSRYDRCGPGTRAAALACGDEDHVRPAQRRLELVECLLGGRAPDARIGARAEAVREPLADRDLRRRIRDREGLAVGVDGDEVDLRDSGVHHAMDRVEPGAADSDDTDGGDVRSALRRRHAMQLRCRFEHRLEVASRRARRGDLVRHFGGGRSHGDRGRDGRLGCELRLGLLREVGDVLDGLVERGFCPGVDRRSLALGSALLRALRGLGLAEELGERALTHRRALSRHRAPPSRDRGRPARPGRTGRT